MVPITIRPGIFDYRSWQSLVRNNSFSKTSGMWHLFSQMILYSWKMRTFLYLQFDFFFASSHLTLGKILVCLICTNKTWFIANLFQRKTEHSHQLPLLISTKLDSDILCYLAQSHYNSDISSGDSCP